MFKAASSYAAEVGFFRVAYDEFFLAVVAVFLGAERDSDATYM
jgi:hypothetical protein